MKKIYILLISLSLLFFSGCFGLNNGGPKNIEVDNDFYLDIGRDKYPNIDSNFKFGRNEDVAASEEVVWDLGGNYIFLEK